MRIFAAGIATETNTFSGVLTSLDDFLVQRGSDVFSLNAWAQPSEMTTRYAYESLRDEILDDLRRAMPVDVVLLSLYGAMLAQG